MAKKIKNPIEVKATVYLGDNGVIETVEDASMHCGVHCSDCERTNREGFGLEQNTETLNIIKDFVEESIKQVEAKLEVAPEDSILYVAP